MSVIRQNDFIESISEAFERINVSCSADYLEAVRLAFTQETNSKQKKSLERLYAKLRQTESVRTLLADDPGMAVLFLRVGQDVRWEGFTCSIEQAASEAVDRAWQKLTDEFSPSEEKEGENSRRKPLPVFVQWRLAPGEQVEVTVAARGIEIDGYTYLTTMRPEENLSDIVLKQILALKKDLRGPVVVGIGVGGTPETAMRCASLSLNDPLNMGELLGRGPQTAVENLRTEIYHRLNAQAADETTFVARPTFLDVKVRYSPVSHAVKPVCIMLEMGILRRVKFVLDGTGPVFF